ncbi:MAG: type II toxin-antitoxin system RelE/ParE family toxin [bacterium]
MCDTEGVGKKQYLATRNVREFIAAQPMEIQAEYVKLVERIECDGFLIEPFGKKLDRKLFEMRLRRGRQVRVIYYYHAGNHVIGLHAFVKKTQQTPLREISQALRMKRIIEGGDYGEDK